MIKFIVRSSIITERFSLTGFNLLKGISVASVKYLLKTVKFLEKSYMAQVFVSSEEMFCLTKRSTKSLKCVIF